MIIVGGWELLLFNVVKYFTCEFVIYRIFSGFKYKILKGSNFNKVLFLFLGSFFVYLYSSKGDSIVCCSKYSPSQSGCARIEFS